MLSLPARDAHGPRREARPVEAGSWPLSDAPWRGVQWSPTYVAFLWYIAVITTYHLPAGDIAMVAALVTVLASRQPLRFPALLGWLGAFIGWAAIAYPVTRFPEVVQHILTELAKIWLIVLVATNALRTRAQIRFFTVFFLACFALYPLRGALVNYYLTGYAPLGRAIWNFIYANPNDLASFALLQLSMVAGLLVTERRKSWVWLAALAGLVLLPFLVLMTQSRGGFTALIVFVILLLGHRRRRPLLLLAAAGLAVSLALIAPTGVWTRVSGLSRATSTERLEEVDPEGSAKQRFEIWKVASKMIGHQPVLGVGVGAYAAAHASYARDEEFDPIARGPRDTHNTVLSVLAETGAPGLLLFLGLVLTTVWKAERIRRACRTRFPRASTHLLYLEFGLAAFLVAGIFASLAYLTFLYIHLVLIWVVAEACRQDLAVGRRPAVGGSTLEPARASGERLRRKTNAIGTG
jgi:O-antigen ligase